MKWSLALVAESAGNQTNWHRLSVDLTLPFPHMPLFSDVQTPGLCYHAAAIDQGFVIIASGEKLILLQATLMELRYCFVVIITESILYNECISSKLLIWLELWDWSLPFNGIDTAKSFPDMYSKEIGSGVYVSFALLRITTTLIYMYKYKIINGGPIWALNCKGPWPIHFTPITCRSYY